MDPDQEPHDGYRVDVVIDGALEQAEYFDDYEDARDHAERQAQTCAFDGAPDWQVTIYDEAPYPPELTDEWTA